MKIRSGRGRFAAALLAAAAAVGAVSGVAALPDVAGASGPVAPLVITTTSLPDVPIFAKYKAALADDGGTKPYKWTLTDGALPPGVKLAKSGKITGAPSELGAFTFGVTVTDSTKPTANTATATLSITVGAMTVDSRHLPGVGLVDRAYKGKLGTDGGKGRRQWSLSSGALPPGLKLSPSGVVSGKPGLPGSYSFDVLVQDSAKPTPDMAGATITIAIAG
jgi:large repetitive protein